jgi:hypothetical protein
MMRAAATMMRVMIDAGAVVRHPHRRRLWVPGSGLRPAPE